MPGKRKTISSAEAVPKKTKKNDEYESFAKGWGWVLYNSATSWIFNCDSGCFYDTCQKEVHIEGDWMFIYQPHKSMLDYDDLYASIIVKRVDKSEITVAMFKKMKQSMKKVENLYLESYNDILKATNNKWNHTVDGTIKQILQIISPLKLEKGSLKMTFEIRGAVNGCCGDIWYPIRLMEWMGKDTSYCLVDSDELKKFNQPATPAILV